MEWSFRNDLPIYTQLMEQLTQGIVSGRIQPGEKLPSVRDIALEAGVNPNTVQRALTDLERSGLVYSQRTSGRFVTEDGELIKATKLRIAEDKVKGFLQSMESIGCSKQDIENLLNSIKEE